MEYLKKLSYKMNDNEKFILYVITFISFFYIIIYNDLNGFPGKLIILMSSIFLICGIFYPDAFGLYGFCVKEFKSYIKDKKQINKFNKLRKIDFYPPYKFINR